MDNIQENVQIEKKKRIDWVDCAKGIGIILVIISHSIFRGHIEHICRGALFSFHMPLFFILSAVTFKLSTTNDQFLSKTERAFKHLIIPALLVYALSIIIAIFRMHHINWTSLLAQKINILTYASGAPVKLQKLKISPIGMTWFFFALFLGRTIFDYLHLKIKEEKNFIIALAISTALGILIGTKVQRLPFSLDIALTCMPFFYCGYYLQNFNLAEKNNKLLAIIFFLIWIIGLTISYFYIGNDNKFYMEMVHRRYPIFPLFYIIAIAGTLFVSSCSVLLVEKLNRWIQPLLYIGKNSLYLYCIHAMDYLWKPIWKATSYNICNGLIRLTLDLILFIIIINLIDFIKALKESKKNAPTI